MTRDKRQALPYFPHLPLNGISLVMLCLGVVCLLGTCGCFTPAVPESPQTSESFDGSEGRPQEPSPELKALADRLKAITEEVEETLQAPYHRVWFEANYQTEEEFPLRVRKVVMSVTVDAHNDYRYLAETPATDDDLLLLRPFAGTLTALDLQRTGVTDAGLQTIGELTSLESLNLAGAAIRGGGLVHLAALNRLQHLDLSGTEVEPAALQALGALPSLRSVVIPVESITDEVLPALGRLSHLHRLDLAGAAITDRGLAGLAQLKSLQTLDLSKTSVTDFGLAHLADMTSLTQLRLSQTQITGAGLSHLGRLVHLEELDLADTSVDDAGLAHLSGLRHLRSLNLTGTRVRGFGLPNLRDCTQLRSATLPPIPVAAVQAVNAVKSWHRLAFSLAHPDDLTANGDAAVVIISDMPELSYLLIRSKGSLHEVHVVNCPQLSVLHVEHDAVQGPGAVMHLDGLPTLQHLSLKGVFRDLAGRSEFARVQRLQFEGVVASDAVKMLSNCQALERVDMKIAGLLGDPLPVAELSELPHVQSARIRLETTDASSLVGLIGKMHALQELVLGGVGLTGQDLAPLSHCTQLTRLSISGIDDPGEPLMFLDAMPVLDQCDMLSCRVGRVRLTNRTGVRRFSFNFGQLDELDIDGAPNLTAVYLGRGHYAGFRKMNIGRLTVRNVPNLLYMKVDAVESMLPFTEFVVADCRKLRSLLLRAPPAELQPIKCRFTTGGSFPNLVKRRLIHVATDQQSLDRLHNSPMLREGYLEDVVIVPSDER